MIPNFEPCLSLVLMMALSFQTMHLLVWLVIFSWKSESMYWVKATTTNRALVGKGSIPQIWDLVSVFNSLCLGTVNLTVLLSAHPEHPQQTQRVGLVSAPSVLVSQPTFRLGGAEPSTSGSHSDPHCIFQSSSLGCLELRVIKWMTHFIWLSILCTYFSRQNIESRSGVWIRSSTLSI